MVPNSDPQSLNGVAVHIELIEQDKIVRMNNVNMIFFLSENRRIRTKCKM